MEIGNRILLFRKQQNLSQEQLAEKMGVARQTISKWELGETSPDLEQAKQLSQIFKVSLDDLSNNDIQNVLISKVNNAEKLSRMIINILKITLLLICILVIMLGSILFFQDYFHVKPISSTTSFRCTIDGKEYMYKIWQKYESPNTLEFYTDDSSLNVDARKYDDVDQLIRDVRKNVVSRGGVCG